MDNIGELVGLFLFIIISIASTYMEHAKKKRNKETENPAEKQNEDIVYQNKTETTKSKNPLDILEEILFNTGQKSPEPKPDLEKNISFKTTVYKEKKESSVKQIVRKTSVTNPVIKNSKAITIKRQIKNPSTFKQLYLIHEILEKPKALRD